MHYEDKLTGYLKIAIMSVVIMLAAFIMTEYAYAQDISISSPEEFSKIGKDEAYPLDGNYILSCDIDMKGIDYIPIGTIEEPFTGTLDGNGYAIKNIKINKKNIGTAGDKKLTGFGIFGCIGSQVTRQKATVKNLVIYKGDISYKGNDNVAAGFVTAVVKDCALIENVAVISSDISLSGNNKGILYGAGNITGATVLSESMDTNKYIGINDIYVNSVVKANGYKGENAVSGILGVVYEDAVGYIENVVVTGTLEYKTEAGYGITTSPKYDGNGMAKSFSRCYQLKEDNMYTNAAGYPLSAVVLASDKVALSDKWHKENGIYPTLSIVSESLYDDIKDRIYIQAVRNLLVDKVSADFSVATQYKGQKIKWTSSSDIVKIDESTGKVTVTTDKAYGKKVTITCTVGNVSKEISLVVGEKDNICFNSQYICPGQELKVLNADSGSIYNWKIVNKKTGKTKNITDDTTGTYMVTEDDLESFIYVTVNDTDTLYIYVSTLPVVYVTSDKEFSDVPRRYVNGTIKLCGSSEEFASYDLYEGNMQLKKRGNSSSHYKKLPFKLKLEDKADLYGVSGYENKHWVLICNVLDHTFIRNELVYTFTEGLGAEERMYSEDVILIFNGEYEGIYQLGESVRIGEGRTEIFDYDEFAEEASKIIADKLVKKGQLSAHFEDEFVNDLESIMEEDYSYIDSGNVTYDGKTYKFSDYGIDMNNPDGGYLVCMDFYSRKKADELATLYTAYNLPLYIDKPDTDEVTALNSFKESSLYQYAIKFNQSFEYALHSDDFFFNNDDVHYKVVSEGSSNGGKWNSVIYGETEYTDDVNNGKHYSEMFDMDSLVQNFLVCEFTLNFDSMKNSFYYHKDVGEKATIGPFWDYDWSMGNRSTSGYSRHTSRWQTTHDGFTYEKFYQYVSWNRMLIRDPYFLLKAYEKYKEVRETSIAYIIAEDGYLKEKYDKFTGPAVANDKRWRGIIVYDDYLSAMEDLEDYLDKRIPWLDEQFTDFDTMVKSLGYYRTSDYLSVESVVNESNGDVTITAIASNEKVKNIAFQVNGTYLVSAEVADGKATITVSAEQLTKDGSNIVEVKAMDDELQYIVNTKYSKPGNYNLIHSNYYVFD